MGQKVHPIGFRVGITKRHQSQWFARFTKNAYAQSILEDRLLRNTLISFANEALNPTPSVGSGVKKTNKISTAALGAALGSSSEVKKVGKASSPSTSYMPKVTHIKIERGLIPYEIAIAIYAENCKKFKSSLNNLKINRELLCKLKKTRRFLISLGQTQLVQNQGNNDPVSALLAPQSLNQAIKSGKGTSFDRSNPKQMSLSESNTNSRSVNLQSKKVFFFKSNPALNSEKEEGGLQTRFFKSREAPQIISQRSNNLGSPSAKRDKDFSKKGKFASYGKGVAKKFSSKFLRKVNKIRGLIIKRVQKRQEIRRRFRRLMLKGLFIQKKGKVIFAKPSFLLPNRKKKKVSKFSKKPILKKQLSSSSKNKKKLPILQKVKKTNSLNQKEKRRFTRINRISASGIFSSPFFRNQTKTNDQSQIGYRIRQKFLSLFLEKNNKRFLKSLKSQMTFWHRKMQLHREEQIKVHGSLRFAPLGYNQKWNLKRLNFLKTKPSLKLVKLVSLIEKQALIKMETLRKYFIAFGTISKGEALNYYQIINFLKNLKIASKKFKRQRSRQNQKQKALLLFWAPSSKSESESEEKKQFLLGNRSKKGIKFKRDQKRLSGERLTLENQNAAKNTNSSGAKEVVLNSEEKRKDSSFNPTKGELVGNGGRVDLTLERVNSRKTIDDECRKIYFIEYLKEIVKKHRTQYLYYYLSTISEARKNLKKIKQFTKIHSNFLFGFDFTKQIESGADASTKMSSKAKQQYSNTIKKVLANRYSNQSDLEKELPEIFLQEIEKQRVMYKQIAELNPKITIKFYSVKSANLKAKASIISDSVIDALEQRKAFRKVVKDAKAKLMKSPNVKGVKIQVSGRLNGAEIARTEWVRAGRVPLQTLRANIDYSNKTAKTVYGIIGVKVWIFKGYTPVI